MKEAGVYEVVGTRAFRGHSHGDVFTAVLHPRQERRAIDRGDIVLLERRPITVDAARITFPEGWLSGPHSPRTPEPPRGGSLVSRRER